MGPKKKTKKKNQNKPHKQPHKTQKQNTKPQQKKKTTHQKHQKQPQNNGIVRGEGDNWAIKTRKRSEFKGVVPSYPSRRGIQVRRVNRG